MECKNNDKNCIIDLGSYLEFKTIFALKEILSQSLLYNKTIIFLAHDVIKIDTATLQLILSFIFTLKQNNLSWEWKNPSTYLIKVTSMVGMKELLKL